MLRKLAPQHRRLLLTLAKLAVIALVAWGIHRSAQRALADLAARNWSPTQLQPAPLILAAVFYLVGLLPCGLFWRRVLVRFGQHPGWLETLRAYYIGHLGKYVPGKALVIILRTSLIRSERVSSLVAAASVFCETLTMMAVGAFIGGAVIVMRFHERFDLALAALGLMIVAGLPTVPRVFVKLASLAGIGRRDPAVLDKLRQLDYRTLALGWLSIGAGWLLVGASLWLVVVAGNFSTGEHSTEWIVCTGAASLAVVAGFMSLIPGGLGVRDAVLMVMLAPTFGEAGALVATVSARLLWLVAELGISAILYGLGGRRSSATV